MDKIQSCIAIISSLIATITLIYKTGFKNNRERERKYYEELLMPFMQKYFNNKNINAYRYCKNKVLYTNENIPMYISFLIHTKDKEKLKKILICDYFELYNNDENILSTIVILFEKMCWYISVFTYILIIFMAIVLLVISFINIIIDFTINKHLLFIIIPILLIAMTAYSLTCIEKYGYDRYTTKINKINNIITKKVKYYDKNHSKYFC